MKIQFDVFNNNVIMLIDLGKGQIKVVTHDGKILSNNSINDVVYGCNIPETLELLAKHNDDVIRASVARNLSTPSRVLNRLLNDKDIYVRWYAADNPSTPRPMVKKHGP